MDSSSAQSISALSQPEAALEDHLSSDHYEEDRTDDRVESEEGHVDPIQTPPPRDPMFHHQTARDEYPPHEIREAESAQDAERE
jgi:hypothetical protein